MKAIENKVKKLLLACNNGGKVWESISEMAKKSYPESETIPLTDLLVDSVKEKSPMEVIQFLQIAVPLHYWRINKPCYSFNKHLTKELKSSYKGDQQIPFEVFHRLPYWTVLIETPDDKEHLGFFVHNSPDKEGGGATLMFTFVPKMGSVQSSIPLAYDSKNDWSVDSLMEEIMAMDRELVRGNAEEFNKVKEQLTCAITMVMYLCSNKPDIQDHIPSSRNHRGQGPAHQQQPLIMAKNFRHIKVGEKVGKGINSFYKRAFIQAGSTVKAHVRKAHWHGFWKGKKDGTEERSFYYKWIPPTFINLEKTNES